jgi:phosphatidylserine/phosphatidylglycerophosphate/cardiolipin synthase-like enzyme
MPKSRINLKAFNMAARAVREMDDSLALTQGRFDPGRVPSLTFKTFSPSKASVAVSPESSYLFLKEAIDAAKSTVLLYIYDISAPYLFGLLADAKARGVRIRAMHDATSAGSAAENTGLRAVARKAADVKEAPSSGERHVFTVCHQKFMVIDGVTVIVESANWAQSSIPKIETAGQFKKGNREWLVRFDDEDLAGWFTTLFEADFNIPDDAGLAAIADMPIFRDDVLVSLAATPRPGKLFPGKSIADAAMTVKPVVSPDNYLKDVKALLRTAKRSIYLQQQYILAGKGVKDLLEIIAEKKATIPNFDLKIITSAKFKSNWDRTKETLDSAGLLDALKTINLHSFIHCHNKGVLVDDDAVIVSSTNWSENSLLRAREAGLLIRSEKVASYYKEAFLLDWKEGLRPDEVDEQTTIADGADNI